MAYHAMLCCAMPCHAVLTRSSYLLTGFLSFSKLFALPVPLLRQVMKVVLSPARELHFQEIKCSCFCGSRIVFWVSLGCLFGRLLGTFCRPWEPLWPPCAPWQPPSVSFGAVMSFPVPFENGALARMGAPFSPRKGRSGRKRRPGARH